MTPILLVGLQIVFHLLINRHASKKCVRINLVLMCSCLKIWLLLWATKKERTRSENEDEMSDSDESAELLVSKNILV
jgi:hypothetical protein